MKNLILLRILFLDGETKISMLHLVQLINICFLPKVFSLNMRMSTEY